MARSTQLKKRIAYFESLRGLAALVIVFYHLQADTIFVRNNITYNGWMMLCFFFILSGCVITMAFQEQVKSKRGIWDFLWGRFLRVYPLHVLTLLIFVVFEVLKYIAVNKMGMAAENAPFSDNNAYSFIHHALMTQAIFITDLTWNWPAWTISAEWWSYIFFAIIAYTCRNNLKMYYWASGGMVLFTSYFLVTGELSARNGMAFVANGFFMGTLLAHFIANTKFMFSTRQLNLIFAFLGAIILVRVWAYDAPYSLLFSLPLVLMLAALFRSPEDGIIKRVLSHPWLVYLGTISFGIYLIHPVVWWITIQGWRVFVAMFPDAIPAMQHVSDPMQIAWIGNVSLLVGVPIIIWLSHISFHYFEKPVYDLRWKSLRPTPQEVRG